MSKHSSSWSDFWFSILRETGEKGANARQKDSPCFGERSSLLVISVWAKCLDAKWRVALGTPVTLRPLLLGHREGAGVEQKQDTSGEGGGSWITKLLDFITRSSFLIFWVALCLCQLLLALLFHLGRICVHHHLWPRRAASQTLRNMLSGMLSFTCLRYLCLRGSQPTSNGHEIRREKKFWRSNSNITIVIVVSLEWYITPVIQQ